MKTFVSGITTYTDTDASGNGGQIANAYKLSYVQSASSGRSLLKSIQICDGAGQSSCQPLHFNWGEADPNAPKAFQLWVARVSDRISMQCGLVSSRPTTSVRLTQISPSSTYISADFNGDGKTDLLERYRVAGNGNWQAMYISNADGTDWIKTTPFSHITGPMVIAGRGTLMVMA